MGTLRAFLQYLERVGIVEDNLHEAVPSVTMTPSEERNDRIVEAEAARQILETLERILFQLGVNTQRHKRQAHRGFQQTKRLVSMMIRRVGEIFVVDLEPSVSQREQPTINSKEVSDEPGPQDRIVVFTDDSEEQDGLAALSEEQLQEIFDSAA